MSHSLTLGDFDFIGGEGNGWTVETIAEGMDFGNAAPVDVVTQTLLQDGASVFTERWENREVTFGVLIKGPDLAGVAEGQAALYAELAKRNTLVWTPPGGWGAPLAYDVLTSWADFEFDDWGEMEPETIGRRFVIRLTCLPFARDLDETVVEAMGDGGADPAPVPVTVVVDNCTSATGWELRFTQAAWTKTPVTVVDGGVEAQVTSPPVLTTNSEFSVGLARTFTTPVDLSTTDLLQIDMDVAYTRFAFRGYSFLVDGQPAPLAARNGTRVWVDVSAFSSVTVLHVYTTHLSKPQDASMTPGYVRLRVEEITRGDVAPIIGTGRQQFRSIEVGGSARTTGSLQITHVADALGEVLAYTCADDGSGYQPPCRQYRTSGNADPTPDTTTASGAYEPLNGGAWVTFDRPAASTPNATYALMARVRATASEYATIDHDVATLSGTSELGSIPGATIVNLSAGVDTLIELGRRPLPPVAVPPGSETKVRIKVKSTAAITVDEVYVFNIDTGALTWVDCGTGTPAPGGPSSHLWIDTASLDWPRPSIWLGTEPDRSDARHAVGVTEVKAMGTHIYPGGARVNSFVVTNNATNAAVTFRHFQRHA